MTGKRTLVYCLDTDEVSRQDEVARPVVSAFLAAHNIDPNLFMVGTRVDVFRHADGSFWLHTWRALPDFPLCESCPGCVKQERVEVPLAAPVPNVAGAAFLDPDGNGPEVAEPVDAVGAANSAYLAALDESRRQSERSTVLVRRRLLAVQELREKQAVRS